MVVPAVQKAVLLANSGSDKAVYLVAIASGCIVIAAALNVKPISASLRSNEMAARLEDDNHEPLPGFNGKAAK